MPVPGHDELRVRVRAAGVNPGDWRLREGSYGVQGPAVLGREVAGTVEEVGPDVTGFARGDEVFGGCPGMVGGWAPSALVTASFAALRPDGVSPEDAAALPVAAGTAYDALTCLDLAEGATLLVNGAGGGVGVAIVQLARARGITVLGTASPAKHELLASYGATPVAYGDGVLDRIRALGKVDAVFDLVGGDALRTVAELGAPRLASVADKGLAHELGGIEIVRDRSTAVLTELARLVAAGDLDPHVTEIHPFDDAAAALASVENGHAVGKVALRL
jgi:NADPH2:quinone reductase